MTSFLDEEKIRRHRAEEPARSLARAIMDYHEIDMASGDDAKRDAVLIKAVALVALAFDMPPTKEDGEVDVADTISKLEHALRTLGR